MTVSQIGSWTSRYGGSTALGSPSWTVAAGPATGQAASTPAAGDVVVVIAFQKNAGTGYTFTWAGSDVTSTQIFSTNAGAGNGTMEARFWIADGSTNPVFRAVPNGSSTNNTSMMAVGVFRGVDVSSGGANVVDVKNTATGATNPPQALTVGTAPNCDETFTSLTTVTSNAAGALMLVIVGGAASGTGAATWTAQTAGWTLGLSAPANNGSSGGATMGIQSAQVGPATASGTSVMRCATAQTLGRSMMFALRGAASATTDINEPTSGTPSYTHPHGTGSMDQIAGAETVVGLTAPQALGSLDAPSLAVRVNAPSSAFGVGTMHQPSVTSNATTNINEPAATAPSYTHPSGVGSLDAARVSLQDLHTPTTMFGVGSMSQPSVTQSGSNHADIIEGTAYVAPKGTGTMHLPSISMTVNAPAPQGVGAMHLPSVPRGEYITAPFGTGSMDVPFLTFGTTQTVSDGVDFSHPFGLGAMDAPTLSFDIVAPAPSGRGRLEVPQLIAPSLPTSPTGAIDSNGCGYGIQWTDITSTICDAPAGLNQNQQAVAIRRAVAVVQALTGYAYGICASSATPCLTYRCGCHNRPQCGCWFYDRLDLDPTGEAPVAEVQSVTLLGVALVPGVDYLLENRRWLVRIPQGALWPVCIDPYVQPSGLAVSWTHGVPPTDDLLLNAVYPLAVEYANDCLGRPCGIDKGNVQTIQREGITIAMVAKSDPESGLTGITTINEAICRDPNYIDGSGGGWSDPALLVPDRWSSSG